MDKNIEKLDIIKVDHELFKVIIENVKKINKQYENNLSLKDSYKNYDCFLFEDGRGGFCVDRETKELCNIFSIEKNRGSELVAFAVHTNPKLCLDCFDGHLTNLYGKHGFKETHREKNWTAGEPDIVYMSFDRILLSNQQRREILDTVCQKGHTPLTDSKTKKSQEQINKNNANAYLGLK